MGISLTYSLLHPDQVPALTKMIEEERQKSLQVSAQLPAPPKILALPEPGVTAKTPAIVEKHALGPTVQNALLLDTALVPYTKSMQENTSQDNTSEDFDLMSILAEFQDPNVSDDQMVLAATQVEKTITKTSVVKKNVPQMPPSHTFQNCTIGSIGTLNIHIHKN